MNEALQFGVINGTLIIYFYETVIEFSNWHLMNYSFRTTVCNSIFCQFQKDEKICIRHSLWSVFEHSQYIIKNIFFNEIQSIIVRPVTKFLFFCLCKRSIIFLLVFTPETEFINSHWWSILLSICFQQCSLEEV